MLSSKKLEPVIKILLPGVVVALFLGLATPIVEKIFKGYIGQYFPEKQYPHAYTLIVSGSLIFFILLWILYERSVAVEKKSAISGQIAEREVLLAGLERRYSKRLEKKMDNYLQLQLQLELKYTTEGTDEQYTLNFLDAYLEGPAGNFEELFEKYTGQLYRLLMIGEPGSGKTTLLLQFARKLVEKARADASCPVPVIMNLASWRNETATFVEWMEQVLVFYGGEFGTSRENAKQLARSKQLILLLDGLDEIPPGFRASCLRKLETYLNVDLANREQRKTYPEVILCCRREEYKAVQANAPVQASISIEPITPAKVLSELDLLVHTHSQKIIAHAAAARKLKSIITEKPQVRDLFNTAFHLQTALALVKENEPVEQIETADGLVRCYVENELRKMQPEYTERRSRTTLGWLAHHITQSRKGVTFELTDLQPKWLKNKWIYAAIIFLIYNVLFLTVAPIPAMILKLKINFAGNLVLSVFAGIFQFQEFSIKSEEIRSFNLKAVSSRTAVTRLITVFLVVLSCIVIFRVFSNNIKWQNLVTWFVPLTLFLTFEALFFQEKKYVIVQDPYKRLYAPFLFDYISGVLLFSFVYCVYSFNKGEFVLSDLLIISLGMGFALASLRNPVLQFLSLLIGLRLEGVIPFSIVRFLNTASKKTGLMEKDGGQWRFRHQLIQDALRNSFNGS